MYLYLGQDTVIGTEDVVGIFDLEITSVSRLTKSFLASAQKNGQVVEVSNELPKSFVVCRPRCKGAGTPKGRIQIYLSQISPATLKKRSGYIRELPLG